MDVKIGRLRECTTDGIIDMVAGVAATFLPHLRTHDANRRPVRRRHPFDGTSCWERWTYGVIYAFWCSSCQISAITTQQT